MQTGSGLHDVCVCLTKTDAEPKKLVMLESTCLETFSVSGSVKLITPNTHRPTDRCHTQTVPFTAAATTTTTTTTTTTISLS